MTIYKHPRRSRKFADTIERTYSTCSWMPDDRFQDAISDAVNEFLGTCAQNGYLLTLKHRTTTADGSPVYFLGG